MADTNTRVIIDVQLSAEDATAKAKDLGASIKAVKEEQKQLKASSEETGVAYQSNAIQLRQLQAEQKAYISISNAAEGSNNQLRAQISLLTQQYNALGREERDNTAAGKALQLQINSLSSEVKTNEEAVGDHRRSVGDYEKANRSATETITQQKNELVSLGGVVERAPIGFKLLGDQVGNVKNQLQNYRQATQEENAKIQESTKLHQIATSAIEEESKAVAFATEIGFKFTRGEATAAEVEAARAAATDAVTVSTAAQTAATEAQTAATAAGTNAAKVFKVALASTGIGAIIILVAALISYLSKFDPIVDKVEQGLAAVGAVVNRVSGLIVGFVTNLKSFGDFASKIKSFMADPIGSFKQLGKEMEEAARQAIALKKAQQDLEDQQKIQEVANARAIQQVQQLTLQARNRSLSEKQRQDLLKQASKIDEDNFKQRTKLVEEEKRQAIEQIKISGDLTDAQVKNLEQKGIAYAFDLKETKRITDEEIDALKDAEIKKTEILNEVTNREEKRQNLSDQIAEKAAAEEEKRQARMKEAREKAAEADKERLESILRVNEGILTARQNEINSINQEIDEKVAKYKKYGATTEQLEKERLARIRQANDEFNKKDLEIIEANNKQIVELSIASIKDEGDRKLAQQALNHKRELEENEKQVESVAARILSGEQGLEALLQSSLANRNAILTAGTLQRQQLIDDNYAIELDKFNQHQVNLAEANVLNAGTDADKLMASQALLDAQYQQQIDQANLIGQDTTLITAQYEEQKRQIQQETVDAAFTGFSNFSKSFQGLAKENSTAYKIAGAIQAKVDAAQSLRNNILIIQENIKALSSQGKLLFPYNIIAIASTLAALASAVSSAKTLVSPVALATGGVFKSDGKGAVLPGYSKTDNTNAFLRSGEAVIVSEATRDPRALAALSAINVAYGGNPLAPGFAMASGGIAQGGFVSEMGSSATSMIDIANLIVSAMQAAPAPIVDVRTITTAQQTNQIAVANANL